ncbi:DUF63 family protein [Salinirubrum litoreum]|uniref:DUF63 family protein n=1 Tax=Salinirubrum litoreum TaxID=1126234 RepID=A0ABD5R627_9EURY|nr:DUF63 family protein [Salinirubrum litoreum]
MAVLPEGFALPPFPYLLAVLGGLAGVGWLVVQRRPPVTDRTIAGFAPWMLVGSASHVLSVVGALPPVVDPLAGTPTVYGTVAVLAGGVWLLADAQADGTDTTARLLGGLGLLALAVPVALALLDGLGRGSLRLFWPTVGLLGSIVLSAGVWLLLRRLRPVVEVTGAAGALAVFGHVLDGVSTAVGIDLLGFGERSPLSRYLIEFAAELPTASVIGSGWLFVVVKVLLAGFLVVLLSDYVEEEPTEGYLLVGFVAAVGLGPGAHNLLLFTVA